MQQCIKSKVQKYMNSLRCADVEGIKECLDTETVNISVVYRAFDLFMGRECWQEAERVVSFSTWNPNYTVIDGLLPEDRAALYGKKKLALSIIKHPNYNADFGHRKNNGGPFAEKLKQWLKKSKVKTRS